MEVCSQERVGRVMLPPAGAVVQRRKNSMTGRPTPIRCRVRWGNGGTGWKRGPRRARWYGWAHKLTAKASRRPPAVKVQVLVRRRRVVTPDETGDSVVMVATVRGARLRCLRLLRADGVELVADVA